MDPSRETHPHTHPGLAGISYRGSGGSGTAPRPRAQHRACWPFLQGPPQDRAREGASVRQLGAGARCCPGPVGRCPEAARLPAPLECPGARPPGGSPAPRAPRVPRGKPSWGQPCSAPTSLGGPRGLSAGAPGGPRPGGAAMLSGLSRSPQLTPAGPTSGPVAGEVLSESSSGCCQKCEQKQPWIRCQESDEATVSPPVRRHLRRLAHPGLALFAVLGSSRDCCYFLKALSHVCREEREAVGRVSPGVPWERQGRGLKAEAAPRHEGGGSVEGPNWGPSPRETPGHQGPWGGSLGVPGPAAGSRCGGLTPLRGSSLAPRGRVLAAALGVRVGIRHCRPGLRGRVGLRRDHKTGALLAGRLAGPLGRGPVLGPVRGPGVSPGNGGPGLWLLRTRCFPPSPPGWRQGDVLRDPPDRVGGHRCLQGPWIKEGLSNLASRPGDAGASLPKGER